MWSEEFLNVVKFYTLGFLLPIIYIGASERVLFSFFISAPHKVLVIDAHSDYTNAVVFFYNSKYKSLCKPTNF